MEARNIIIMLEGAKVLEAAEMNRYNVDKLSLLIAFATDRVPSYEEVVAVSELMELKLEA